MNMSVHFSSATDQHATPDDFFAKLNERYGPFDLDPCCLPHSAKAPRFFTPEDDGMAQRWRGRVFMNPPYGNAEHPCKPGCRKKLCEKRGHHSDRYRPGIADWVRKAYESAREGALVVCLLPARTDAAWWHDYAMKGEVEFIRGRLKFGGAKHNAPFPSAVVVFFPAR